MKNTAYHPSLTNLAKYSTYTDYLLEYTKHKDWKSIKDSLKYVLFKTPPTTDRIITSKMGTFWCRGNTNDFQYVNYAYEKQVKNYIYKNRKQYDFFIDIGACMGEYCIWLAKAGMPSIAFEPVPSNFKALSKNVELNQMQQMVTVLPVGLGSKAEKVYFDIKPVLTSASGIDRSYQGPETNVEIKRFDDLLPELPCTPEHRVIMKLDVEGMEVEVLQGAADFIKKARGLALVMEKTFSGEDNIRNFLASLGTFVYEDIDEVNMVAIKQ
ncbi:FkbM family methyltransferase [Cesiribacter andamanensis]|uniref:Methyltransferase, FkbM family n=1 Tax=Cesiribacter andamanensis AMV16 TaxID=1279009 RepID=M7NRN5_9BACT|nr:FkbM family methyltransferase [Cesiribacter andamanensis]EMR04350.1 methyltransferase, FkbM family [Cesiribacter andamanensis AMV16]